MAITTTVARITTAANRLFLCESTLHKQLHIGFHT